MTAKKLLLWIGLARIATEFIERAKVKEAQAGNSFGFGPLLEAPITRLRFNSIERKLDLAFIATGLFVLAR